MVSCFWLKSWSLSRNNRKHETRNMKPNMALKQTDHHDIVVAALYKFASLPDFREMRQPVRAVCREHRILGTLLLAEEGVNGTIAGTRAGIDAMLDYLRSYPQLATLEHKESYCEAMPFKRLKVKLKNELITLGDPTVDPRKVVGTYVDPKDWNALITDPDVILIDTRNDYEVAIGTFKGAIDPDTESFTEFPDYIKKNLDPKKHKKVAMFCTGGIRCEKASSYMLEHGFEEVYHLRGGILKYLEEVPDSDTTWEGECYVFDDRVSVNHSLEPGSYQMCHGCGRPIHEADLSSDKYELGVSCPACYDELTEEQRAGFRERQRQVLLARRRNQHHIGDYVGKKHP